MTSDELGNKQLEDIQKFCTNKPNGLFYKNIVGGKTVHSAIKMAEGWKNGAIGGSFTPKAVVEAGSMFALYRDLASRYASRSMLWKKGLDQKMFNIVMVQAKNEGVGD